MRKNRPALFRGRHFTDEVIILCVRWYLRFSLNVDGNPSYPKAATELKRERKLGRRCRCRTCPYLDNIVEQDHRAVKRRINKQGFRSLDGARRTIPGYETIHMIRKGQVRWPSKRDVIGQILFTNQTFGLKTA